LTSTLKILPAAQMLKIIPEEFWLSQPIYQHPEFLLAVAPRTSWYAEFTTQSGTVYFPFTGQKWFGRWRLFQVPFCQKFSAFVETGQEPDWDAFSIWWNFLAENTWSVRWPYTGKEAKNLQGPLLFEKRINQTLSLNFSSEEIIKNWKSGRKQALKKSAGLNCLRLEEKSFAGRLEKMMAGQKERGWKPDSKESKIILRLSGHPHFQENIFRFGVFDGEKCLSLILLIFWNNRFHYLFSTTTPEGFTREAMTRFFFDFFREFNSRPSIFDFEGSSLPGVHAFFKSLGAEDEEFILIRKPGLGKG
jgi:hypothetical protein